MTASEDCLRIGMLDRGHPPHPDRATSARETHRLARELARLGHEVHLFTQDPARFHHDADGVAVHRVVPDTLPMATSWPMTDGALRWGAAVTSRITELAADGTVLDLVEAPSFELGAAVLRRARLLPVVVRPSSTPVSPLLDGTPDDRAAGTRLAEWLLASADGILAEPDPRALAAAYAALRNRTCTTYDDGLRRFVEHPIDLHNPALARFVGAWDARTSGTGTVHVATTAGSAVHFTLPAARAVSFRIVGHQAAGIATLDGRGHMLHRDLFRPAPCPIRWSVATRSGRLELTLTLAAIGNPRATGHELWLAGVGLRG